MTRQGAQGPAWFKFPIDAWLSSPTIAAMSPEAEGALLRLLLLALRSEPLGTLPADDATLAQMSRLGQRGWAKHGPTIRTQFESTPDGRIESPMLAQLITEMGESHQRRANAGRVGADKRWHSQSNGNGNAIASPNGNAIPRARGELRSLEVRSEEVEERDSQPQQTSPALPQPDDTELDRAVRLALPIEFHDDLDSALAHAPMRFKFLAMIQALHEQAPAYSWDEIGVGLRDLVVNGKHERLNARQFRNYVQGAHEQLTQPAAATLTRASVGRLTIGEQTYLNAGGTA